MNSLYLYRHGETAENRLHILQGCMPGTLTSEGRAQIAASVPTLQSIPFDIILCSDIQRCKDTALIINEVLQLPIVYTPLLRERDWGNATGMIVDGVTKIRIQPRPLLPLHPGGTSGDRTIGGHPHEKHRIT